MDDNIFIEDVNYFYLSSILRKQLKFGVKGKNF